MSAYREVKFYQIYAQGRPFSLQKEQLRFDSPNAFTDHFDQPHPTNPTKGAPPLQLRQDPALFEIIVQYLSGYDILPLADKGLPIGMSVETATKNLLKDASKLRLNRLVKLLTAPTITGCTKLGPWAGLNGTFMPLEDLVDEEFEPSEGDAYWHSQKHVLVGNTGHPVTVLATNKPIQLLLEVDIHPTRNARMEETSKLSFVFPKLTSSFASDTSSAPSFSLSGPATPDALIHIDQAIYRPQEVEQAWAEYRGQPYLHGALSLFTVVYPRLDLGQGVTTTKKMLLDVWAESIMFTVKRPAPEASGKYDVQVLNAKLRTRSGVLDDLVLGV